MLARRAGSCRGPSAHCVQALLTPRRTSRARNFLAWQGRPEGAEYERASTRWRRRGNVGHMNSLRLMRISDIRQPDLFQRLVQQLYLADYGYSLQIVDDSGGDGGNDGCDPERKLLMAIYCPEKELTKKRLLQKARADLKKAARLMRDPGYSFDTWVFVTPGALPEKVQATLRAEALLAGLTADFRSGLNLEITYLNNPALRSLFPELDYPRVDEALVEVNEKLDSLLEATRPPAPIEVGAQPSREPPEDERAPFETVLSISFASPRLAELQRRVESGDSEALFDLERFQLEAANPRDAAAAIMIRIEHATERLDFRAVARLCAEGQSLASRNNLKAEQGVFLARGSHAETVLLVNRELELTGKLAFSLAVGIPIIAQAEASELDVSIPQRHKAIAENLQNALVIARESRNLESLFQVAIFHGMTATQASHPPRLLVEMAHREDARPRLDFYEEKMEASYRFAVAVASALQSSSHIAMAYSNLSNDLVLFGDLDRARSHANYALERAKAKNDQYIVGKIQPILSNIERLIAERATARPR